MVIDKNLKSTFTSFLATCPDDVSRAMKKLKIKRKS